MTADADISRDASRHTTDEQINTCTHLAGAVFALLGGVLLVVQASVAGKPWHIVSFGIYGLSLVCLMLASTLHHGVNAGRKVAHSLRVIDYHAIYLLIAGTYTPICLVLLRGPVGWSVFGVAWTVAAAGILLKTMLPQLPKSISNTLYLAMGWLALTMMRPLLALTGWPGLALLALGGVFYSVGAVIFALEKPNPLPGRFGFHEIWHLFVLLGAGSHFAFMYRYVLPH